MLTITAANSRYGRRVITELLARGVGAGDLVATVRDRANAVDLIDLGI